MVVVHLWLQVMFAENQWFMIQCFSPFCFDSLRLKEFPRRVLLSWVFFDRQLSGFLREDDLQNILLSLGLYLTTSQVSYCTVTNANMKDLRGNAYIK